MSGRNRKRGLPSGLSLGIELLILAIGLGVLAFSRGSFLKVEGSRSLFQKEEAKAGESVSSESEGQQEAEQEAEQEALPLEADSPEQKSAEAQTPAEEVKDAEFEPVPTPKMAPVKVQDASDWMVAAPVAEGGDDSNMVPIDESWAIAVPLEQGMVGETQEESSGSLTDASVLVVNGTYKNGVAAYWEGRLREEGYTSLATGNNNSNAAAETIIYTSDPEKAAALTAFFPGAQVVEGKAPATVTLGDGSALTQDYDVCIVVGTKDAESL